MNFLYKIIALVCVGVFLVGCGAYFNQPMNQQPARAGELTTLSNDLREFPLPSEPVVVGVYNFKDQTGQYKNVENGSSFSTAVSQGATTMLVKALEDSRWFTPIERENLANLLQERNIIRSTREEYRKNANPNVPSLPPLLYAGMLLEGGIVSYDSNIITGGVGARYFGIGGSTQYREDRITVYLRAVSTSNGKVLKTVYVSKTILSQAVDVSLFRYVNFQRLLEVETGYTKNEPVQMALKDAIEKAVHSLIIEGIESKMWGTKKGPELNQELVERYNEEKRLEESKLLYDRSQIELEKKNTVSFSGVAPYFSGDYAKKRLGYGAKLGYSRRITRNLNLEAEGGYLNFKTGESYERDFIDLGINLHYELLPQDEISPYGYVGFGYLIDLDEQFNGQPSIGAVSRLKTGVGVLFRVSEKFDIKAFAEGNFSFSDELDLIESGERDDYYYNFGAGINFHFGSLKGKPEFDEPQLISQPIIRVLPENKEQLEKRQ